MKSRFLMCFTAIALIAALSIPVSLAAQEHPTKQPKYKLIDLGTFGGPTGYLCNDPTGGGGACPILNNRGTIVSAADTSIPNPNYPNGNGFFPIDPFVFHAFQWQDGALHDLGALPSGYNSFAYGINANGLIAGASENGTIDPLLGVPELNAVLWKDGNITNLGTLDGGYESAALAVNNHSQVAGLALNPDPLLVLHFRAVLWLNGAIQDLGTLGTGTDAFAYFINERGQIAGNSNTSTIVNPVTGLPTQDPFLWENGKMTDLGTLGGTFGFPNAMNNQGQVVGQSNVAGDVYFHPFLWPGKDGKIRDLGTLGGCCGYARWITDAGDVVGGAWTLNDQTFHAFLWRQGVMTDLTNVSSECTDSLGINSKRQVVGYSCSEPDALLWENGQEVDLNIFNHPDSGLQQLVLAYNINDAGEIVGLGVPPGVDPADVFTLGHVFVLIPCQGEDGDCKDGTGSVGAVSQVSPASRDVLGGTRRPSPLSRANRFHILGRMTGPSN